MRPSLIQCFPHPFTRQWPATSNPVTCECRQLYALVSVCCCVPNTHLLVLHESAHLNTNLITSMPKGPKYVDFAITPRTTPEDLCGFLVRAEMAATGPPFAASAGNGGAVGAPTSEEVSVSHASPGESLHEGLAPTTSPTSASQTKSQWSPLSRSTVAQRHVVVVCLHGIADASAAVQSALMDLLMFEQVRNHHRAARVPTLRIVAFCSSRNYAILLPEPLRALFTLSTYVSTLASDSAVVLQTATATSSSIVNKRFMLEVMTASDGQSLLETVTLSGTVTRYLRHLLLVVRGSVAAGMSPGALALRRIPRWMTILKALAILFMPDEELLRSRVLQTRSTLLQSYSRVTSSTTFERTMNSATHRAATPVSRSMSPETQATHQQPRGLQSVGSDERRQVDHTAAATVESSENSKSGGGDSAEIKSFSHVVVSPSDVACVLHCLVGHLMTMPREMVPSEEILSATSTMMGNAAGSGSLVEAYGRMLDVHRYGKVGLSLQDPAMWDAVAASWTLRNLHGIANPTTDPVNGLDSSLISNGTYQNYNTTLRSLESVEATGEADPGLRRSHGTRYGGNPEQDALAASSHAPREQCFQTLNNRPFFSVAEAWKWTATNKFGILDMASTPMLNYWETSAHTPMYSPYDAVYGHDTTYIRRMTVEEYVQELKEEEADVRGVTPPLCAAGPASEKTSSATPASSTPARRATRQYEQRRMALSSCNPNVVFFSKYPMYDRLGRELCVAFQMQDIAVQQELRRLEKEDGRDSRRSGVRLSAELLMESDTTGGSRPMSVRASAATAEGHELTQTEEVSRVVRPSHIDGDTLVDIDVSATSNYPSVSAICTSSCPASARPSDFSIFRDSSGTAAAGMSRGGLIKRHSCVPVRSVAEEEGILIHRSDGGGGSHRAASMPPAALPRLPDDADGRRSQWRWRSEKRHRSRSSGGGGRQSRVRFINDDQSADGIQREEQPPQQRVHGALPLPPRLSTPPPVPLSEGDKTRVEETAVEDATRWTATSRASAAVRATKQLFRSTTHTNTSTASRATATPSYRQPIASSAYGLSATAIAASKVGAAVEHNVQVCAAAMPPQLYSEEEATDVEKTPELQCGSVVRLGSAWYRLVHFHLVAEVYVAVRISVPAQTAGSPIKTDSQAAPDQRPIGKELMVEAVTDTEPQQDRSVGAAAPDLPMQPSVGEGGDRVVVASTAAPAGPAAKAERNYVPCTDDAESCPLPTSTDNACVGEASSQEYFVYRWRVAMLPRGGDEARRAALGLSLCAPAVHVHGIRYADGGGITVLSMPLGYRAVPMSGLPLSLRSYTTLMRVVLKAFSTMMARRTVHGNLSALGELFLAWPMVSEQSSSLPRVEEEKQRAEEGNGNVDAQGATRQPFMLLFHWERWVDFSMFVDRNAGRTIPFDFEDGTSPSVTTYGKDLLGSLQLFLEHPLAAELTSEQYILLQKLIVIATEPTQVANYLIQMKNLMLSLPTDTEALHQSCDAAVMHHAR